MNLQVRKICLLGDFSVGKTSTVRQFVESRYDEKYLTTVGVKIDTKTIHFDDRSIKLVIWDIAGTDQATPAYKSYLRGMAGYLLVADGTRPETLQATQGLQQQLQAELGDLPWVGLLNKADLVADWQISDTQREELGDQWQVTSAKTGENVEEAFSTLARNLAT